MEIPLSPFISLKPRPSSRAAIAWLMPVLVLATGCQSLPTASTPPSAFATDGCSLFPDRLPGGPDWRGCCVSHDLAYWRGGSADDRLDADRALKACVGEQAHPWLGSFMYAGVRMAGGPSLPTPFRWGFGWPYGRGYLPVSADEDAQLAQLRAAWAAANPAPAPAPVCDASPL